ncbi:MAG: type II toxin-antitoxin system VapC family toxin [Adlercreutzia equolifaciens]
MLDVNAAIAIAKGTEEGRALRELMIEGEEVIAPHFFLTELGNVVWQIVRAGELGEEDFPLLFERAAGFVDRFVPLFSEAIHAAIQNHSVYDMLYFIVTRRNAATLFTFDKKLRAVCEANGVNCLGTASL